MKIWKLLCTFLLITTAVTISVNSYAQSGTDISEDYIQIVNSFGDALVNQGFETMENLLHEDYMGYGPFMTDEARTKSAEINYWKETWANQLDDLSFEQTEIVYIQVDEGENAGEWVLNYGIVTANYTMNPETDVSFSYHSANKIVDDQIAVSYAFYNVADIWQQLGYEINPPSGM